MRVAFTTNQQELWKAKQMSTESERARRFAQKISHIGLTNTLHAFPTALALIHGRYRCREASAARDTLTGETRRSQGARESFYDFFSRFTQPRQRARRATTIFRLTFNLVLIRSSLPRDDQQAHERSERCFFMCSTQIRATRINF